MWSRLSEPWQAAVGLAWEAWRAGCVPIGAVITDAGGQIVARGRNRLREASGEAGTIWGNPLAHAELNALVTLDYGRVDPHTCILHTTVEPCPLCTGALYMSGLRQVRFASRDAFGGGINLLGKTAYMSRKPITIVAPSDPDLETIMVAWHLGYALAGSFRRPSPVIDALVGAFEGELPRAVALARDLHDSGLLRRCAEAGLTAGEALDSCEGALRAVGASQTAGGEG